MCEMKNRPYNPNTIQPPQCELPADMHPGTVAIPDEAVRELHQICKQLKKTNNALRCLTYLLMQEKICNFDDYPNLFPRRKKARPKYSYDIMGLRW